jgi:RecB family endonuclease NucS
LREENIQQLLDILEHFADWFPEHRNRKLYGILAAVDIPEQMRRRVLEQGLYLAQIHDDLFELQVPDNFQPRRFDHPTQ